MTGRRLLVILVIGALIAAFFALRLDRYISLDYFRSQQEAIAAYYRLHPWKTAALCWSVESWIGLTRSDGLTGKSHCSGVAVMLKPILR